MMARKYTGQEGEYLIVDDNTFDHPSIVWYFPRDGEYGIHLGECSNYSGDGDLSDLIIEQITKKMLVKDNMRDGSYIFSSVKEASDMIEILNNALLNNEQASWPTWAMQAKMEGWNPPEGWKPEK
jgi:hypothetical protein